MHHTNTRHTQFVEIFGHVGEGNMQDNCVIFLTGTQDAVLRKGGLVNYKDNKNKLQGQQE